MTRGAQTLEKSIEHGLFESEEVHKIIVYRQSRDKKMNGFSSTPIPPLVEIV
jgi:hypothetical protein